MKYINYEDFDITGFAGIRERILVMDHKTFKKPLEGTWSGFAGLQYLAHAYFKPGSSTGLHHHENVDIISVITRGGIQHKGTLGDGQLIKQEQVQVQTSGETGFSHNEINAHDDISGMVQMWFKPNDSSKQCHQVFDVSAEGTYPIYGFDESAPNATQVQVVILKQDQEFNVDKAAYVYIFDGQIQAENQTLHRGSLIHVLNSMQIKASSDPARLIIITHAE